MVADATDDDAFLTLNMDAGERLVWPAPGRCIYCGAEDVKLTDEHVIPFALTANSVVFEKASCESCARLINPFEQFVLRQTYGSLRVQIDSPTRDPKRRKKTIDHKFQLLYEADRRVSKWTVQTDWNRCPVLCPSWEAPLPSLVSGDEGLPPVVGRKWLYRPDRVQAFIDRVRRFFRADGAVYEAGKIDGPGFQRFIAKVAHGYAVAHFGFDSVEWLTPDVILGHDARISRLVGGSGETPPARPDGAAVRINFGHPVDEDFPYLLASIRLFEFLGTPEHIVVLGRPTRPLFPRDPIVQTF